MVAVVTAELRQTRSAVEAVDLDAEWLRAGRAMRAILDSGLFLRVRDVEHPVWQIHMLKEPMLTLPKVSVRSWD